MQLVHGADAEQVMVQTGIAEVELRPLDLTLAQILVPRTELPDQEELLQQIQVAAHGHLTDLQRVRQLGDVDDLTVVVGEHEQQAMSGRRRQLRTELRQIPLRERTQECAPPRHAVGIVRGQERARESAPAPQVGQPVLVDLDRLKSGKLQVLDPSGQRLGGLTEQIGPGAAKDQEPAPGIRVYQDPKDREQVAPTLHFIDDGDSGDGLQRGHGLVQTCEIERIFEVEISGRVSRYDLPRQGRLPALPGSHDGNDRRAGQRMPDGLQRGSYNHSSWIS